MGSFGSSWVCCENGGIISSEKPASGEAGEVGEKVGEGSLARLRSPHCVRLESGGPLAAVAAAG